MRCARRESRCLLHRRHSIAIMGNRGSAAQLRRAEAAGSGSCASRAQKQDFPSHTVPGCTGQGVVMHRVGTEESNQVLRSGERCPDELGGAEVSQRFRLDARDRAPAYIGRRNSRLVVDTRTGTSPTDNRSWKTGKKLDALAGSDGHLPLGQRSAPYTAPFPSISPAPSNARRLGIPIESQVGPFPMFGVRRPTRLSIVYPLDRYVPTESHAVPPTRHRKPGRSGDADAAGLSLCSCDLHNWTRTRPAGDEEPFCKRTHTRPASAFADALQVISIVASRKPAALLSRSAAAQPDPWGRPNPVIDCASGSALEMVNKRAPPALAAPASAPKPAPRNRLVHQSLARPVWGSRRDPPAIRTGRL